MNKSHTQFQQCCGVDISTATKPHNICYLYECTQLLLSLAVDVHKPLCGATLKGSNYHLTPHYSKTCWVKCW